MYKSFRRYRCDRCGDLKEYTYDPMQMGCDYPKGWHEHRVEFIDSEGYETRRMVDLCPKCSNSYRDVVSEFFGWVDENGSLGTKETVLGTAETVLGTDDWRIWNNVHTPIGTAVKNAGSDGKGPATDEPGVLDLKAMADWKEYVENNLRPGNRPATDGGDNT